MINTPKKNIEKENMPHIPQNGVGWCNIKNFNKELNYGMTIYGPHRDDFSFKYNNNDLKYFGSQGQQRLAVLAFKLAEIDVFTDVNGTAPLLLLDDILVLISS